MGFPSAMFVNGVDDNLTCCICLEVLKEPTSCQCGSTFCKQCIDTIIGMNAAKAKCPTCRVNVSSRTLRSNLAVAGIVANQTVFCSNTSNENTEEGPPSQRRRLNEAGKCPWTGKLQDFQHHSNICPHSMMNCSVTGCSDQFSRSELSVHNANSINKHMVLLLNTKMADLEKRLKKDMQDQIDVATSTLLSPLHSALVGFRLYHSKTNPFKLIAGIPGPANTSWEGGLYPLSIEFTEDPKEPPKAKFSHPMFHSNVYPAGTICISTLDSYGAGWSPDFSLTELLLDIQQFLAHPNHLSPAQKIAYMCFKDGGVDAYNDRIATQAKQFPVQDFYKLAKFQDRSDWITCSVRENTRIIRIGAGRNTKIVVKECHHSQLKLNPGTPLPVHISPKSDAPKNCPCSCCKYTANGTKLWDDTNQYRYLHTNLPTPIVQTSV